MVSGRMVLLGVCAEVGQCAEPYCHGCALSTIMRHAVNVAEMLIVVGINQAGRLLSTSSGFACTIEHVFVTG